MCHYCHILKYNPRAPPHRGIVCLDCSNTHSQVPMVQRKYNQGKPLSLIPSAPPAPSDEEPIEKVTSTAPTLFGRFLKTLTK